jgi:hypothetical protein
LAGLSPLERAIEAPSETLQHGLLAIALDADNRLVVARAFATQMLARDPDPEVTQQLLDAYEQRSTPNGLRSVIAQALITRRNGSEYLVAALARHYDFLDNVTSTPLSIVVPALVAMNERRAVPGLVEHLRDPATAPADLIVVADGLARLADRSLSVWIVDWLRLYRASTAFAGHEDALFALSRAARALSNTDASPSPTELAQAAQTATPASAEPGRNALAQRDINAAFAGRIDTIRDCIIPELARNPLLAQVRIAFIARPDGSAHGFAFAPSGASLASCLSLITQGLTLPTFNGEPTVASYVIQLRSARIETIAPAEPAAESTGEWWSWYARELPPTDGAPWWNRYVEHDLDWLPPANSEATRTPMNEPTTAAPPVPLAPAQTTPAADDTWWLPPQP